MFLRRNNNFSPSLRKMIYLWFSLALLIIGLAFLFIAISRIPHECKDERERLEHAQNTKYMLWAAGIIIFIALIFMMLAIISGRDDRDRGRRPNTNRKKCKTNRQYTYNEYIQPPPISSAPPAPIQSFRLVPGATISISS